MERLTYRGKNGKGYVRNDGYYNHVSLYLARVAERLTAYEDTGLEPEEIPTGIELANVYCAMQKLKKYEEAEQEGRLVVLPCKVGDTLYTQSFIKGAVMSFKAPDICWIIENILSFGKTIYLTRQEAEAALGGVEGG